jgi:hypothetical protein
MAVPQVVELQLRAAVVQGEPVRERDGGGRQLGSREQVDVVDRVDVRLYTTASRGCPGATRSISSA